MAFGNFFAKGSYTIEYLFLHPFHSCLSNHSNKDFSYRAIGIMSGTSMDGIDIAYCFFHYDTIQWRYRILKTHFVPYTYTWPAIFKSLTDSSARRYFDLHHKFGEYLGGLINDFIRQNHIDRELDLIVSHGQTIYHDPAAGFTMQLGDGAVIAAITGFPVVSDLRSGDMALGGQGAPIVPIADKWLFAENKYCLNLGGIANLSAREGDVLKAWDLAGCNLVFNRLAHFCNKDYDEGGRIARAGKVHDKILSELWEWEYLHRPPPKSLDALQIWPAALDKERYDEVSIEDKMCTYAEFLAIIISESLGYAKSPEDSILITGGGAHNTYLTERIEKYIGIRMILPNEELINFKEALAMAFFGILRIRGEANYLSEVTGAMRNGCGGALHQGWKKKESV